MLRSRKSLLIFTLLISMLVVSVLPARGVNAEEGSDMGLFVVEKTWANDTDEKGNLIVENSKRNRPTSVNIRVEGSDGSVNDYQIKEEDGWKLTIRLPMKDNSNNPITYTVHETDDLEKYQSSATSENKMTINMIPSGRNTGDYVVSEAGFANVPEPTVRIDPILKLSEATRELDEGFVYQTNQKAYVNPTDGTKYDPVDELISYIGEVKKYNGTDYSVPGSIVLTWPNKAKDLNGNEYSVRITISNISIRALADMTKKIAIINYHGILNMQSYVAEFTEGEPEKNIVGVRADVKVEVLGVASNNYVRVLLNDIDIPDQVDFFRDKGTIDGNSYYGLDYPYAESVVINGTPSSDVYISDGKKYLVYDNAHPHKFASEANGNDSTYNNGYTRIEYLAPASSYSFTWAGSDCGTSIIMDVALPTESRYLNKIDNKSSLYKVRYFYMNDVGEYPATPDSETELRMVKPATFVEATKEDKTPEKAGYALDTRSDFTGKWSGTTKDTNDASNPLELDVYFKKQYTVIYHDNVGDIVWKPETQTNPELDYGVPTPGFDKDKETDGIQPGDPYRQGYDFLGWSEEPELDPSTIPAIVTKNADYWAHWAPGPNKYKVEYYYEVNGKYPAVPDFTSTDRAAKTEDMVTVTEDDKIPQKAYYVLNNEMTAEWTKEVLPDGTTVLKVYFRSVPRPVSPVYAIPVTGVEKTR